MALDEQDINNICAIVVTFHPDADFVHRINRICSQVKKVIIVDNGSSEAAISMLAQIAADHPVELVCNQENVGIGCALNTGMKRAEKLGFHWVVLFDQDSEIDDDLVSNLKEVFSATPHNDNVATIGSSFRDIRKQAQAKTADSETPAWADVKRVITSGSLLSLEKYNAIGAFREDLFIYYVDNEYCARAIRMGYRIIKALKPTMTHTYGSPTQHKMLGKAIWVKNYKADSYYYMARNYTVFMREYGDYIFKLWIIKSFSRCLKLSKSILFFEENKGSKIRAIFSGWLDGIFGKLGKRQAP